MTKPFIIAFLAAVGIGFILLNPWVYVYYLILLTLATVFVLIVIVYSLVKRTKDWKTALLCLAVGYTTALTSYSVQIYLSSQLIKKRNHVIAVLYDYRDKYDHFPSAIQEIISDVSTLRAHYVPDTSLRDFTLYTKDFYGMPWVFSSKDSTWTR